MKDGFHFIPLLLRRCQWFEEVLQSSLQTPSHAAFACVLCICFCSWVRLGWDWVSGITDGSDGLPGSSPPHMWTLNTCHPLVSVHPLSDHFHIAGEELSISQAIAIQVHV